MFFTEKFKHHLSRRDGSCVECIFRAQKDETAAVGLSSDFGLFSLPSRTGS